LNGNPKKDEIISALVNNGRQKLFQYEEYLIPEIFSIERNYIKGQADTPLLEILKEHIYEKLKNVLGQNSLTLSAQIEREKEKNACRFGVIQRRFAEYSTSYTKSSFVLYFVLQLLFNGVKDDFKETTVIFDKLFECVTNEGIQRIKEFKQYIAKDDLDEQLNDDRSLLHSALRMYYREEVKELFSNYSIDDKNNLYNLVADNIPRHGWIATIELESVKNKIAPIMYQDIHTLISKKTQQSIPPEPPIHSISGE
jgi:hypothetical protein